MSALIKMFVFGVLLISAWGWVCDSMPQPRALQRFSTSKPKSFVIAMLHVFVMIYVMVSEV